MKNKILLIAVLIVTLIITGCNSKKEETKTLVCTSDTIVTTGVQMILNYKVTYTGDYVELIKTEEKIISDDESILEKYKTSVESLYSPYQDVEYYNYSVEISDDTLISKTEIDYLKVDTNKLIEIDSNNATFITDGKIKINDVKAMYEAVGATCK